MRALGKALVFASALVGLTAMAAHADVAGQYYRPRHDDPPCDAKCVSYNTKESKTWQKMVDNDLASGSPNRVDVTYNFLFNHYYMVRNFSAVIDATTRGLNWIDTSRLYDLDKQHLRAVLSDWRGRAKQMSGDPTGAYADFAQAYNVAFSAGRDHYTAYQIKELVDDIRSTSKAIDDAAASVENAANPAAYAAYTAGLAKQNSGDFAGALALYDSAISQSPAFAEYWRQRATVKGKLLDAAGHVADAAHAVELYQQTNKGRFYYELGRAYLQARKTSESLANITLAVRSSAWEREYYDFYDSALQVAESEAFPEAFVSFLEGRKKFANKDFAGALAAASAAIAKDPTFGDYYTLRGRAAMAIFYASGALPDGYSAPYQDILKGVQLNGWNFDNARVLADFDYDVSLPHWNDHPEFYGGFIKEQFRDQAYQFYFEILARSPEDSVAQTNYAYFVDIEKNGIRQAQSDAMDRASAENKAAAEARERAEAQRGPDTFDKLQAWCDSVGGSTVTIQAAAPPICYGFMRH